MFLERSAMKKTTIYIAHVAMSALFSLSAASSFANTSTNVKTESKVDVDTEVQVVSVFADGVAHKDANGIIIAQAGNSAKSDGRVVVSQGGTSNVQSYRFDSMPSPTEIDAIMSKAISTAFANADGAGFSFGSRVVKNAPYAAEIINERTQVLPDGNQIVKRTTQSVARDSVGRTRTEVRNENGETRAITIFDPLDDVRYVLSPQQKSASRLKIGGDLGKRVAELREKVKAMAKDGKTTLIEREPGKEVVISNVHTYRAGGDKGFNEEIRVSVSTASPDAIISTPQPGVLNISGGTGTSLGPISVGLAELGPLNNSFRDRQWAKDATTKELGVKSFDGVQAEGKLRSYTIPAGAIGNRNPITVSTETWYSPDLQVTVYSKYSDPRSEEVVYRLSNIKRNEPSLTLFSVPDGYKISDGANVSFTTKTK
jgi:hypothetical protein